MPLPAIASLIGLAAIMIAMIGKRRFRHAQRLPMQWWLDGTATWTAPRALALSLIPAVGLALLVAIMVLNRYVPARPGQEAMVIPTFIGIGLMFLAIQCAHLWLVDRTLRRLDN